VAEAYLVIARDLGVEINLSKSLVSEIGVAEFAKRILSSDGDLSPVSPRLISHLLSNVKYLPTVLTDLASRGLLIKPFRAFLNESPLRKIQSSEPLYMELWDRIPLESDDSLVIAPFLETNKLNCESGTRVLLDAADSVLNKHSQSALAKSVDFNQEILVKL
jgi:hypothetical protein